MRIIFFHHAGGDRYAFAPYRELLEDAGWEMTVYEFPGRGDRFNEPLLDDALALAGEACKTLDEFLHGEYVVFGNSMGSLVAYLLLHRLQEDNRVLPVHFFAAARKCPASYSAFKRDEPLSDEEFWQMVADYGGPASLIRNAELRELYGPILRADYSVLQTYAHAELPVLSVPATILYGKEDRYSRADLQSWRRHFEQEPVLQAFDGGHFFVYEQPQQVLELITHSLARTQHN
jgi:surfactin synthase thioesterase subunit